MTKKTIAYKAFNKDWTCRDFKFEVGETYKHDGPVEMCGSGFHACLSPFDCWLFYDLTESNFAVVELGGETESYEAEKDTKIVSGEITIKAELTLPEFIKAGVDWLIEKTKGSDASEDGSGDSARIGSSGDYAQIGSSGDSARIEAEGENSVIASAGMRTRAKGAVGTWISLAEFKDGKCVGFATGCIGQDGLKPDVFYIAKNGKLVEHD